MSIGRRAQCQASLRVRTALGPRRPRKGSRTGTLWDRHKSLTKIEEAEDTESAVEMDVYFASLGSVMSWSWPTELFGGGSCGHTSAEEAALRVRSAALQKDEGASEASAPRLHLEPRSLTQVRGPPKSHSGSGSGRTARPRFVHPLYRCSAMLCSEISEAVL